jgi:predicted phage baseplate assembly protein
MFASYAYGGGKEGNVGIGTVKNSPQLPAGFKVSNPIPTWGGDDGESVADGERKIPPYLRHRDRAVSAADFEDIVRQTPGIDLGRVEALPLFEPGQQLTAPGVVTLMVIPNDPRSPQGPVPNSFFLGSICQYLDPRRLLTTEVYVQGPVYVGVAVSVGIKIVAGSDVATVRDAVTTALKSFLSPLIGGPDRTGWPVQKTVESRELWTQAVRVNGVSSVNDLWLFDLSDLPAVKRDNIAMTGLNLPRLDAIRVTQGDPELPSTTVTPTTTKKRLPVPVLPLEC